MLTQWLRQVSQACSFQSGETPLSGAGFVFIVDNSDMQLVTLAGLNRYTHQTLPLGRVSGYSWNHVDMKEYSGLSS
jgi:hypothetical protein